MARGNGTSDLKHLYSGTESFTGTSLDRYGLRNDRSFTLPTIEIRRIVESNVAQRDEDSSSFKVSSNDSLFFSRVYDCQVKLNQLRRYTEEMLFPARTDIGIFFSDFRVALRVALRVDERLGFEKTKRFDSRTFGSVLRDYCARVSMSLFFDET